MLEADKSMPGSKKRYKGLYSSFYGTLPLGAIDPDIREIVRDLNKEGYYTDTSCAGGPGHGLDMNGNDMSGYIVLRAKKPLSATDRAKIRKIVESYTDVPFTVHSGLIRFISEGKPVGKPYYNSSIEFDKEVRVENPLIMKGEVGKLKDVHLPTW